MALLILALLQRSEERFSRNAETDPVCRPLLEKKIVLAAGEQAPLDVGRAQTAAGVRAGPAAPRPRRSRPPRSGRRPGLLPFSRETAASALYTLSLHDALPIYDQIKEMTRKVSAEVDLVHQQTQNQRYGSSHIGATA